MTQLTLTRGQVAALTRLHQEHGPQAVDECLAGSREIPEVDDYLRFTYDELRSQTAFLHDLADRTGRPILVNHQSC